MPDHAALAVACGVVRVDRFNDLFYSEELLIAGDFLDVGVKKDEILGQLHQPFGGEQRDNIAVLHGRFSADHVPIDQLVLTLGFLLAPDAPEVFARSASAVFYGVFVGRHNDLCVFEKLGNIVFSLIADHLLHRLIFTHRRRFALDHRKRDPVYKQHNVGANIFLLVPTVAGEFLCYVKNVVARVFPIDIFQIKAFRRSVRQFFKIALAEHQRIVDFFACTDQPFRERLIQIGDRFFYVVR